MNVIKDERHSLRICASNFENIMYISKWNDLMKKKIIYYNIN